MFNEIWTWITSFWWAVVLTATFSFGVVGYWVNHIIKSEMERGGEEYGERATTRMQKWATAILVISVVITVLTIVLKVLTAFDLIHLGA